MEVVGGLDAANSNRIRARVAINLFPGIHLRVLQRILGTSFSTVRYHVSTLERDGEVIRRSDKRYDRLYPRGTSEAMQSTYAALHRKASRKVLHAMADQHGEGLTLADLASRAGLSTSTVVKCVGQLSDIGLIARSYPAEGRTRWEIRDRDLVMQLLAIFRRSMMDVAADNLIDLWDF